jgi:hypothetical protein
MTIAGLPTSSPQPAPTEPANPALSPGQVLEAKVVAIDAEGVATLATPAGPLAAELPAGLTPGSRATFIVQSVAAGLKLQLIEALTPDEVQAAKAAAASAKAASASAAPASPPAQAAASPTALTRAVLAAAGTQAPAAPLLAALQDKAVKAGLPAPVARAAEGVLATMQPASRLADPAALAQAVRTSGLFPAPVEGDGQTPPTRADLGSALRALREALVSWNPKQPAAAVLTSSSEAGEPRGPVSQPAASGSAPVQTGQPAADLRSEQLAIVPRQPARAVQIADAPDPPPKQGLPATPSTPVARLTTVPAQPPARLQTADSPPRSADGAGMPGQPNEPAAPPVTKDTLPPTDERLAVLAGSPAFLRTLLTRALAVAQSGGSTAATPAQPEIGGVRDGPASPTPLPRADAPPRALPPVVANETLLPASAVPLRETLLSMTSAALDRLTVAQAASLPSDPAIVAQPTSTPHRPEQAWVLDLPIALPGETGTLPMRIWRDGRSGSAASAGSAPGWTVEFAIDTTATGPVHARVRLGGQHVSVALWAERSETFLALRSGADALRRGLDEEAFAVDELTVHPGAPRRAAQVPGGLLDARS